MRQRLIWVLVGIIVGLLFAPSGLVAQGSRLWLAASNGTQPVSGSTSGAIFLNLQ